MTTCKDTSVSNGNNVDIDEKELIGKMMQGKVDA